VACGAKRVRAAGADRKRVAEQSAPGERGGPWVIGPASVAALAPESRVCRRHFRGPMRRFSQASVPLMSSLTGDMIGLARLCCLP
jgi:hypothetical protein